MSRVREAASACAAVALLLLLASACRTGRDYPPAGGPRYAAAPPAAPPGGAERPLALRVVSFNVEFARHVDGAIALLASDPGLRGADVVLLQEMDSAGAARV